MMMRRRQTAFRNFQVPLYFQKSLDGHSFDRQTAFHTFTYLKLQQSLNNTCVPRQTACLGFFEYVFVFDKHNIMENVYVDRHISLVTCSTSLHVQPSQDIKAVQRQTASRDLDNRDVSS